MHEYISVSFTYSHTQECSSTWVYALVSINSVGSIEIVFSLLLFLSLVMQLLVLLLDFRLSSLAFASTTSSAYSQRLYKSKVERYNLRELHVDLASR
jgi:hypothetical protein